MRPSFFEACRCYVNRFTMEHVPAWAANPLSSITSEDGAATFYAPQFRTDREWYANTTFPGEPGHILGKQHCHTEGQTWPLGRFLKAPFRIHA